MFMIARRHLFKILILSLLLGVAGGCLLRTESVMATTDSLMMDDREATSSVCETSNIGVNDCAAPTHAIHHLNEPAILLNGVFGIFFLLLFFVFFTVFPRTDRQTLETKFSLTLKRRAKDSLHWFELPLLLACFRKGILHPKLHTA